jgi:hypothetical protein
MWSTSAGGHLMKVVNLTGFTVVYLLAHSDSFHEKGAGVIAVCFGWLTEHINTVHCMGKTAVWRESIVTYSSKVLTLISGQDLLQLVLPIKHTLRCDLELKMGTFDSVTYSQSQTNQRDQRLAIGSPLVAGSLPWWPVLYNVLKHPTDSIRRFFH